MSVPPTPRRVCVVTELGLALMAKVRNIPPLGVLEFIGAEPQERYLVHTGGSASVKSQGHVTVTTSGPQTNVSESVGQTSYWDPD